MNDKIKNRTCMMLKIVIKCNKLWKKELDALLTLTDCLIYLMPAVSLL